MGAQRTKLKTDRNDGTLDEFDNSGSIPPPVGYDADLIPQLVEPEFDRIHANEIWETLQPMVDGKLSPKERKVIYLRYKNGLTFAEIGVKLRGMTRSAAQAIHVRALGKLRAALRRSKKQL